MNALAYKSKTIPSMANDKASPISSDDLFDEKIEFSQARIQGFFRTPSLETEIDETVNSSSIISTPAEKQDLLRLVHDSIYRQKTSVSSQKWKGYVTQKNEEYFTAIITDVTNKNQDEEVEIPLKAISKDDFHLVIEGARFDWHIGYERVSGTTQKYSKILFKRMPRWTSNDFVRAKKLKQKFKDFLSNGS